MWLRAFAVWLLLLLIAIINGAIPETILRPAWASGQPTSSVPSAYDLMQGRIWPLVVTLIAPVLAFSGAVARQ